MKALLLAAGLGTRLRPITYEIPKCLAPVKGLPLLGHWLHLLERHGYREVLINTGYQADRVSAFLETFYSRLRIELVRERELLGTGGTIRANWDFFRGERIFLVAHADNFTNANLAGFHRFAGERLDPGTPIALGLFRCPRPRECGIVELDGEQRIRRFHEKVENPPGNLANAGFYACHRALGEILQEVERPQIDLARDVLPRLEGRMLGWDIGEAFLLDIGNPEAFETANLDPRYRLEFPPDRADVQPLLPSPARQP